MKKQALKIALFGLVAAALAFTPASSRAEEKAKPAEKSSTTEAPPTKPKRSTYSGKVASVDAAGMSFTVGKNTVVVSSETKITKHGKPATFSDIAVGETVGGSGKKDESGKLNASTVRIGEKGPKKDKKKAEGEAAKETPKEPAK